MWLRYFTIQLTKFGGEYRYCPDLLAVCKTAEHSMHSHSPYNYKIGGYEGIRTHTIRLLRAVTLPIGLHSH